VGGLRPLEVLALSLAAPAALFFLLWFWVLPRARTPLHPPRPVKKTVFHSRTRPIYVFEGRLSDRRMVRAFQGLTPGLEGTEAGRRALELLGREAHSGVAVTLLLRNGSGKALPALAGNWVLRQGKGKVWKMAGSLRPGSPLGKLLAGLFTPPSEEVPPGEVERHLFLPSGKGGPLEAEPLQLEGPGVKVSLRPRRLPAQDVYQAWEQASPKKG